MLECSCLFSASLSCHLTLMEYKTLYAWPVVGGWFPNVMHWIWNWNSPSWLLSRTTDNNTPRNGPHIRTAKHTESRNERLGHTHTLGSGGRTGDRTWPLAEVQSQGIEFRFAGIVSPTTPHWMHSRLVAFSQSVSQQSSPHIVRRNQPERSRGQ